MQHTLLARTPLARTPPSARRTTLVRVYSLVNIVNSFVTGWPGFSRALHTPPALFDGVMEEPGKTGAPSTFRVNNIN